MIPFTDDQLAWLQQEFDRCWPMIERAVRKMHEPYGRDYVWGRVLDGTAQLFPGSASVVVTEINTRMDGSKVINGWLAAGDRTEIENVLLPIAENYGRQQGCSESHCIQRPGFMKKPLPGYRLAAVVMRKEL